MTTPSHPGTGADRGSNGGVEYFQIAEPFGKQDFLHRYQQVSLFSKLLFAPFGLHYQTSELLNEKGYLDCYTQTFQQLEDVMSKCIFRHFGYSDDRIIATMHKFIGQQNDASIIKEIKSAVDSLVNMASPAQVVDFPFDQVNGNDLFSTTTCQQVLQKIMDAISSLHQHIEDSDMEVDLRVQRVLGITITKRIASPVLVFHQLSSKEGSKAADIIQQLTESLTICVHKQIKRHLDDTSEEEVINLPETTNISLNYDQYIALIEQFGRSLELHSASDNVTEECKDVNIEQLQSGSVFRDVNKFLHPTISFILQLCDKLKASEQADSPQHIQNLPVEMAEKSLHFTFVALAKLDSAKALANAGDAASAMEELSADLLDSLEVDGEGEVTADVVLPVFLHTQLLIERSKYHAEIGNLNGALADCMVAIALDAKCAPAYAMRSQLLLASLQSYEPLEAIDLQDIAEETKAYLQQLFPSDVVQEEGIEEQDLVMHQAAEDALLAFLLGGSSDIASAAAAEEAARETCRKFAKATYAARRKVKQAEMQQGGGGCQDSLPRPWLVSAYFSGYELLSTALQVFGESTLDAADVPATIRSDVDDDGGIDGIDEGDYAERKEVFVLPPDHLLDQGSDHKLVLRELDPKAYDLLVRLVEELEQCNEEPNVAAVVDLDVKDKEVVPDEKVMFRVVPSSVPTDDLLDADCPAWPRLRDSNAWRLVTCGHEDAQDLEHTAEHDGISSKREKLKVVDVQPLAASVPVKSEPDHGNTTTVEVVLSHCLADEVAHCLHLAEALTLLQEHSQELLGITLNEDGSVADFSLEVPEFAYSLLSTSASGSGPSKQASNGSGKYSFGRRNAEQADEFEEDEDMHRDFNPEDFFKAHFGGDFNQFNGGGMYSHEEGDEDDDDEDEWEDADEDDDDEESEGKDRKHRKNKSEEDDEDVWEDCDDDEDDDEAEEEEAKEEEAHEKRQERTAATKPTVDVDDMPALNSSANEEEKVFVSSADELDIEHHDRHNHDNHHDDNLDLAKTSESLAEEEEENEAQDVLMLQEVVADLQRLDLSPSAVEAQTDAQLAFLDDDDEADAANDDQERRLLSQFDTTVLLDHNDNDQDNELDHEVHDKHHLQEASPVISRKLRARLLNILGSLVYLCGDATGALRCLEASLHFDPTFLDSQVKLASLLIDMDEHDKAGRLLQHCLATNPDHPVVYLHYAELTINQNDFPQAVQQLRKAHRYATMGWSPETPKLSAKDKRNTQEWITTFEQRRKVSVNNILSNIFALYGVSTFRENPNKPEVS
jgi:hypothetical protein